MPLTHPVSACRKEHPHPLLCNPLSPHKIGSRGWGPSWADLEWRNMLGEEGEGKSLCVSKMPLAQHCIQHYQYSEPKFLRRGCSEPFQFLSAPPPQWLENSASLEDVWQNVPLQFNLQMWRVWGGGSFSIIPEMKTWNSDEVFLQVSYEHAACYH